jgi:hypothetical protein
MGVRLIRTDKNGTKYYEDNCCPRCGGRGYLECYKFIEGGVCFQCQGSGFGLTKWKEYTPEYQAILDERRKVREQKKAAEFDAHRADYYKDLGLDENGHAFVVLAKTFEHKDELKNLGARFNGAWWYFNHTEESWDTAEIDAIPLLFIIPEKGICKWDEDKTSFEYKDVYSKLLSEKRTRENSGVISEFYGNVGDRVQVEATITGTFSFEVRDPFSWNSNTKTMYGYKMTDSEGHRFVWITGSKHPHTLLADLMGIDLNVSHSSEERDQTDYWDLDTEGVHERLNGMRVSVKGSVKEHKERESIKETVLTRCKFKPVA